jgi:hypothetical protein
VVAVACDNRVPAGAGRVIRADQLAARVPVRGWQRLSCGPGSKGERLYDWALADAGHDRRLLIRRSVTSGELAYYLCWSPRPASLAGLIRVAGARWAAGECFQAAKNEAALDHYQARGHVAWYRHVTLAMCAHAWLAVIAAGSRHPPPAVRSGGPGDGQATQGAGRLRATFRPAAGQSRLSGQRAGTVPVSERDPAAARDLLPARSPARPPPALVAMAAPASGSRPALPLPAAAAAPVKPALPGRRAG